MKYIFFIGKGGVGKSTLSALTALYLAHKKCRTLLVSMDPAHSLSDIFQTGHATKPVLIVASLKLVEVDQAEWTRSYLNGIKKEMQRSYRYLTAINLEHHFDVIKHSPSLEEYALLHAFKHYMDQDKLYDAMILDMPPTALTLKFFNLPRLSLTWLNELGTLRRRIIEKKRIISRIKEGRVDSEPDKIESNLNRQEMSYREIMEVFCDPDKAGSMLVANPDALSVAETKRVLDELRGLNMPVRNILINKWADSADFPELDAIRAESACRTISFSNSSLIGAENLQRFLDENIEVFNSFLQT